MNKDTERKFCEYTSTYEIHMGTGKTYFLYAILFDSLARVIDQVYRFLPTGDQ